MNVTVPFTTLIGATDQPGELAGYGPITAEVGRRIAGDAVWRRVLTARPLVPCWITGPPGTSRRGIWPSM